MALSDRRTDIILSVALLLVIIGASAARWVSGNVDSLWPFAVLAIFVAAVCVAVTAIMARGHERSFGAEASAAWRSVRRPRHG